MRGVKCIPFVLWINILSVITGFEIELSQLHPVIDVGKDLELICWVTGCPVNVTFTWETLMDRSHGGDIKDEQTVSHLHIRHITVDHNNKVTCKATCNGVSKVKTSDIHVFSFPQDPVLPKIKNLIANQKQKLNCTVHNVFPLERLQIKWLRGDKTLDVDCPEITSDHVQNYSCMFDYTPSVLDLGKNISCMATLNNPDIGLNKTRFSNAEYGPGTITVSSNNTSVKLGEHLELTCHADGNPKPTILWRKEDTELAQNQSQNEKLIINNASWSQAGWYLCDASNAVGSQQMKVKVIVLGPPNIPKIQLSHRGDPKVGENISILCSSDDESAELNLYRQSQSIPSGALNKPAVLLNIPHLQITDAGIYICEAKNNFGTERSMINITVKAQHDVVKTVDLPVAILAAVGSVSLLTITGLLIQHCRKKSRSNSSNITLS